MRSKSEFLTETYEIIGASGAITSKSKIGANHQLANVHVIDQDPLDEFTRQKIRKLPVKRLHDDVEIGCGRAQQGDFSSKLCQDRWRFTAKQHRWMRVEGHRTCAKAKPRR
jgi:hypothetical protein